MASASQRSNSLHKDVCGFWRSFPGFALVAASDEFHQTFVKSRTLSVRDVLLDVTGALLGLLIGASFARRHPEKSRATTHNQVVDAQL